ncbi:hypothetical protein [Caballeronia glebae]|uniref:hypothetical protein n=1 Tax=Caballeronia glebae TaxID=1777143 RepID=UPI0038BC7A2D
MFASDKYNSRFRAASVRLEEIVHMDTMIVEGRIPSLERLRDEFVFVREALSLGSLSLFPCVRAAATLEELEDCLFRLSQPDSLGFLIKARQARLVVADGELRPSWELTRTAWFAHRSYEKVLSTVNEWASAAHRDALASARGIGAAYNSFAHRRGSGHAAANTAH